MTEEYPQLAELLASWFHQDFDLVAETVEGIMAEFVKVTPEEQRTALKAEVVHLLEEHADELEEFFERELQPEIIPSEFSGSTRGFLAQLQSALA